MYSPARLPLRLALTTPAWARLPRVPYVLCHRGCGVQPDLGKEEQQCLIPLHNGRHSTPAIFLPANGGRLCMAYSSQR